DRPPRRGGVVPRPRAQRRPERALRGGLRSHRPPGTSLTPSRKLFGRVVLGRTMARFRLVFFGLPLAAILLARDGHDVALAARCRRDAVGVRRARRLLGPGRLLLQPKASDPALLQRVRALEPDLLVSWFWTTRLPMPLVQAARLGGIGAHPSL